MIFEGYENYIAERTINLTQYIGEKGESEFHDNFFKDISGNSWEKVTIKSLLSFFGSDEEEHKGLIEQLLVDGVNHVLLIIPQKFINNIISEKRRTSKDRIRPKEFSKNFIEKFSYEFTSNEIECSILVSGSRHKKDTDALEQWLNLRELQKSLKLNADEAYLLSFKDMKIDNKNNKNAISLELKEKYLTIKEDCSVLLGSSRLFRFNTSTPESIIKITNNGNDNYIDFITENIDIIKSNNHELQDEYLDDEVFDDFGFNRKELQQENIKINFDKTSIIFSSHIPVPKEEKKEEPKHTPKVKKKEESPVISTPSMIGTDPDTQKGSQNINLKDDYLVFLNKFITPYESQLIEVHYHLIKSGNKLIFIGGSKSDSKEQAIAKVVADLTNNRLTITNLSAQTMKFEINDKKVVYEINEAPSHFIPNTIGTDRAKKEKDISVVEIKKGESHSFTQCIEFPNSSIDFNDNGVEVKYIDFVIGSFKNKLEFNRHYFRHFGTGNIIDNKENLDHAGRIYDDGKKNILGSTISRNPMLLKLRGDNFTISNQIKEEYTLLTKTATKESEIIYHEEESFSEKELLSRKNHLSIAKDGVVLVEISIQAN